MVALLSSTWLLHTTKQPVDIANAIRPFMDDSDRLFVVEITENTGGYLPQKAWAWIERREKQPG